MSNRRTNVLMVEDEPLITELITEVLSENGFAVHAVADGETALRYLDDGPEVDVLFTDINLEGRMDGSTLAKQVRDRPADCLLFGALFARGAGADDVALDFSQKAVQSGRSLYAVDAADIDRALNPRYAGLGDSFRQRVVCRQGQVNAATTCI